MNTTKIAIAYGLMAISLFLNVLGIYCLHKQVVKTNVNIILMNLSLVETLKVISDMITVTVYQFFPSVYEKRMMYFELLEIGLLSVLFLTMILISLDRLLIVLLHIKYKRIITKSVIQKVILFIWLLGVLSTLPFVFVRNRTISKYFFMFHMALLFVIISVVTYTTITIINDVSYSTWA